MQKLISFIFVSFITVFFIQSYVLSQQVMWEKRYYSNDSTELLLTDASSYHLHDFILLTAHTRYRDTLQFQNHRNDLLCYKIDFNGNELTRTSINVQTSVDKSNFEYVPFSLFMNKYNKFNLIYKTYRGDEDGFNKITFIELDSSLNVLYNSAQDTTIKFDILNMNKDAIILLNDSGLYPKNWTIG